ncbi:MAG TPA: hypothetical protein VFO63_09680 [Blastocatellia bacterium]|nr:hypothetical protein [Blastocatellia bacterium]
MVGEAVFRGEGRLDEKPYPVDAPRRRGRPKKPSAEAQIEHTATIGVLATAASAIFIPLSVVLGPHWILSDDEAFALAESLQKALTTLPGSTYGDIKKYLDRFVPWIALTIVVGQVCAPKIALTQQIREAERNPFPDGIEIPPSQHAHAPVRERSNADGYGSQAGSPDTFGTFPGAD